MRIGVQRVGRDMTPGTLEHWAQLLTSGCERACMIFTWFRYQEVKFGTRCTSGSGRVRQRRTKKTAYSCFGHETQDAAARKCVLGHSRNIKPRLKREHN